jgi:hypothetical protein
MTTIELPDEQVAALKAKAAALGLSLEAWFKKLAEADSPYQARARKIRYSLDELIGQCDASALPSAEDRAWIDDSAIGREAL